MKARLLLYVSIICSVAGLILLYFISQNVELLYTPISQITADDIGKNVKVCGEVTSKSVSKNDHVFLSLNDSSGVTDVVVFSNIAEKLNAQEVKKEDIICVIGTVDEYQESLEIIAKKIER